MSFEKYPASTKFNSLFVFIKSRMYSRSSKSLSQLGGNLGVSDISDADYVSYSELRASG